MFVFPRICGPLLALLLQGCTNIQNDATRTRTEGALAGCAAGSVLGTLIGDNRKSAASGCALGGAAGLALGQHVAHKKREYAREEDYLRDLLAHAQNYAETLHQLNQQLLVDIRRLTAEESRLVQDYQSERARHLAMTQMRNDAEFRLQQIRRALVHTDRELEIQRQVLAEQGPNAPAFYRGSAELYIQQLEQEHQQLGIAQGQFNNLLHQGAF